MKSPNGRGWFGKRKSKLTDPGPRMKQPLADALAAFAADLRFSELPLQAVQVAKMGIADCIGVAIAGSHEPPVQILRRALMESAGTGVATVLGARDGLCTTAAEAAWINGAAGHVLDFDDVARGHPSVVIVPAILAVAEVRDASGADLITAYVAGYEVWMELMQRERGSYQDKGWHHTPMLGAVAASAACANLCRFDCRQTSHALGVAAAQASGIVASHGTMMKSVQVGRAAHTAVLSARMAEFGMTAAPGVLDHERGFLKAISQTGDVDVETGVAQLGSIWHICTQGLGIKRYPVCYRAHRAIDAALELRQRRPLLPDQIARIEVSTSRIDAMILVHHRPASGLEAKFSMEFAVACALLTGNVGLQQLDDEFVRRSDIQSMMALISVVTHEDYAADAPGFSVHDSMKVYLNNGEVVESEKVRYARGHAKLPLTSGELQQKFLDCIALGNPALDGKRLFDCLQELESLPGCRTLLQDQSRRRSQVAHAHD